MRSQELRIALLGRLVRLSEWVSADDLYETFDASGRGQANSRLSQTIRRAVLAGFVEADASQRPRKYRITDTGRAEFAVLSDPFAMDRRRAELGRKRSARRRRAETAAVA